MDVLSMGAVLRLGDDPDPPGRPASDPWVEGHGPFSTTIGLIRMSRFKKRRPSLRGPWLARATGVVLILGACATYGQGHWLPVEGSGCTVWADKAPKAGRVIHWTGGCDDGKLSGDGVLEVVADGESLLRFEGTFVAGKAEGQGDLERRSEEGTTRYRGEFAASLKEGEGLYELADGGRYWGSFKADVAEGAGVYQGADGSVYLGEVQANQPHGAGLMVIADGASYQGGYVDGERQGQGVLLFPDGSVFRGGFQAGKADGQGVFLAVDGAVYQGVWRQGKADGVFRVTRPDGEQEQQTWKDDVRVDNQQSDQQSAPGGAQ